MWSIIFCLRIIGVVFFVIFIFLIAVTLYLLISPFTYRGGVSRESDGLELWFAVHDWLSIGRFEIGYENGKKKYCLHILWGLIRRKSDDTEEQEDSESSRIHTEAYEEQDPIDSSDSLGEEEVFRSPEACQEEETSMRSDISPEGDSSTRQDSSMEQDSLTKQDELEKEGSSEPVRELSKNSDGDETDTFPDAEILREPRESDQRIREPRPPREVGEKPLRSKETSRFGRILQMVLHPGNRRAVRFLWRHGLKIVGRVLPHVEEADTCFALGEPDLTGEILGVIAMCPSVHKDSVSIRPDFTSDDPYLEGRISLCGRVRMYYIAFFGLQILFSKDCRRLYRQIRSL